jgi:hypothetical protein
MIILIRFPVNKPRLNEIRRVIRDHLIALELVAIVVEFVMIESSMHITLPTIKTGLNIIRRI